MTNNELKNLTEKISNLENRVNDLELTNKKNKIKKRIYYIIMLICIIMIVIIYYFIFKNIYSDFLNYLK